MPAAHILRERRRAFVCLAASLSGFACLTMLAASASAVTGVFTDRLASGLWECNFCHQQYQGESLPASLRFTKCPAKEMKQNHFWIKKN
jgi:hypothetical protein